MKTYEGMFLLDAGQPNFEEAIAPINTVFERNGVEPIQVKKWDERRLAYAIRGRRRGMYVLTYFKADPERIGDIERDVQLSDQIIRVLILAADHLSQEQMQSPTPAETEGVRKDSDAEGEDGEYRGDRGDDGRRRPRDEDEADKDLDEITDED